MFGRKKKNTITICLPMNDSKSVQEFINARIKNLGRSSVHMVNGNHVLFSYDSILDIYNTARILKEDFPENVIKIVGKTIVVKPKNNSRNLQVLL